MGRITHTYALFEVSAAAYDEVASRLRECGYGSSINDEGEIDMHGIALVRAHVPTSTQETTMSENDTRSPPEPKQKPSIGRIVHYWPYDGNPNETSPRAAIITQVHSDTSVNLAFFEPHGKADYATSVPFEHLELPPLPERSARCRWPPRV